MIQGLVVRAITGTPAAANRVSRSLRSGSRVSVTTMVGAWLAKASVAEAASSAVRTSNPAAVKPRCVELTGVGVGFHEEHTNRCSCHVHAASPQRGAVNAPSTSVKRTALLRVVATGRRNQSTTFFTCGKQFSPWGAVDRRPSGVEGDHFRINESPRKSAVHQARAPAGAARVPVSEPAEMPRAVESGLAVCAGGRARQARQVQSVTPAELAPGAGLRFELTQVRIGPSAATRRQIDLLHAEAAHEPAAPQREALASRVPQAPRLHPAGVARPSR